jgi:hypothetical protein
VEKTRKKFLSVSDQPYPILVRSEYQDRVLILEFLITKDSYPLWTYRLYLMNDIHQEQAEEKMELIGLRFIQNMILTDRFIRSSGKIESLEVVYQDGDWYTLEEESK